ncbi:hypothetical protein Pelo_2715 [Pelomyxa schiedti]|nr:hypothetical protein Pelo_2715 [Pelomyxa schiedti]
MAKKCHIDGCMNDAVKHGRCKHCRKHGIHRHANKTKDWRHKLLGKGKKHKDAKKYLKMAAEYLPIIISALS